MTVVVDPSVRIIPDTAQVFVLHPGEHKRYFRDFVETQSVFLDLPGIQFAEPPDITSADTRNLLRMSRRIRAWRNMGSPDDKRPSRNPDDHRIETKGDKARYVHEVEDLYVDAKAGDLIVVPGKGYGPTLLIGEFLTDFDPGFTVLPGRYQGEAVAARRVNWLHLRASKADFSQRLIRLLQNRQAIIRVTAADDRHEVYERTYGDYVWGGASGNLIRVTSQQIDLNDLSRAADLTNYFAAQYLALKQGKLEEFLRLPFSEGIERFYDKKYFGGVGVEIHSPGFFARIMRDVQLAGYVSAMLALSSLAIPAQDAANAVVRNTANAVVTICDVQLEEDIRRSMEMYANLHLWEDRVCKRAAEAQKNVGLESEVKVTAVPDQEAPMSAAEAMKAQEMPRAGNAQ